MLCSIAMVLNKTKLLQMKAMKTILALMVTLLALTACNKEDDIDEIFVGRTWFMTGIAYNGANNSSETRNFYTDTDRNCYFITFSSNTFQGKLSSGVTISGTWQANGKHQTITLNLQQKPSLDNLFLLATFVHSKNSVLQGFLDVRSFFK